MIRQVTGILGWWGLEDLDTTILVNEWDTLSDVFNEISSGLTTSKLKIFLRRNPESISTLQPWSYIFTGDYSFPEFFEFLNEGPQISYTSATVLEWRSIYDIDQALTNKEYSYSWEYISFVTNDKIIAKYVNRFEFLELAEQAWTLTSLEWFLYPETYFIDISKNFVDQLVFLQLDAFNTNVWLPYKSQIEWFSQLLASQGYEIDLSFYDMMILASIIEKEERDDDNKSKIASVFLNRLDASMRIDADISLCYGLEEPYETCTPTIIVQNLDDADNVYNTRAVGWLTPTPIANIHKSSLIWLLESKISEYYFYLHDDSGRIHLWKDLSEHNKNKSKYIK